MGVPIAVAAFVVLQRTLHLPERPRRKVKIDYLGAALISAGVSAVLIWVSLAGHQFDWLSWPSAALVGGGVALLITAVRVEVTRDEPLIPTHLFRERVPVLAAIASASVGVALFGVAVFLSQYLQISRGESPTASGLLTIPMMVGILISSTLVGRRISKTGRYKKFMVTGATLLTVGLALMGMLDEHTSLIELGAFMSLVGLGVGMVMQNLVLVVQNSVPLEDIGAASALITFFRSLGGATGVSVLGAILGSRASSQIADGLAAKGIHAGAGGAAAHDPRRRLAARPRPGRGRARLRQRHRRDLPGGRAAVADRADRDRAPARGAAGHAQRDGAAGGGAGGPRARRRRRLAEAVPA